MGAQSSWGFACVAEPSVIEATWNCSVYTSGTIAWETICNGVQLIHAMAVFQSNFWGQVTYHSLFLHKGILEG